MGFNTDLYFFFQKKQLIYIVEVSLLSIIKEKKHMAGTQNPWHSQTYAFYSKSSIFGGKAAASTKPAPLQGFRDPRIHKLTDRRMHTCIRALMYVIA